MRRRLKCRNERNPCPVLYFSQETASLLAGRKEGTTSSQHGAYAQGYTHPTMVRNNGQRNRKVELILKSSLSSDCGLKFARMKLDLVVIAGQQTAVNTFPFLVHKFKARLAANKATWLKSTLVVKKIWQVRCRKGSDRRA